MMALAGVEPETLVSEPDALTTRPPPCAKTSCCVFEKTLNYHNQRRYSSVDKGASWQRKGC